jgi:DNA-binding response OmpR family regulator
MPRVPAKVLIAEDEPELRGLIRMTLEVEPFELIEVADVDAALEVARRERPDAVVLDRLEGFRAGADDYVAKPFSPTQLVEKVNAVRHREDA